MQKYSKFETDLLGVPLSVEIGKMASFANGACFVKFGETVVLSTVTMSEKVNEDIDFLSLVVNFEDRVYASGRIPGSFSRREGKPSEASILASRLIDRSIRPLFSSDFRNDVSVSCMMLSVSNDCLPEVVSLIATSISLAISDVPWNGPIASCLVGLIDGKIVINPSVEKSSRSDLRMFVSSTKEKVTMIEAGANQVPEDTILEAIRKAHEVNSKLIDFISEIQSKVGQKKMELSQNSESFEIENEIVSQYYEKISSNLEIKDKILRDKKSRILRDEIIENFSDCDDESLIDKCISKIQKGIVRNWIFDKGKRVDGRSLDEIRELSGEVGLLPKTHGSALFSRGLTQVLSVTTLSSIGECKLVDEFYDEHNKYYMHHYNFPPFSVGEARSSRAPGRREIGHGALAERALYPVIPSLDDFPYTIRVVSDVLSSNGSTSQASVCGSTLSLMDAGVPISDLVAGISCGLVTKGENWVTFVDIQGIEDFFGDMDFKVAGTRKGVTAIQMDIKVSGLSFDIIENALKKTRDARFKILDFMESIISKPRDQVSKLAPKIVSISVPEEKIRDIIGPGGSVVRKLSADFDSQIDIEDDGKIYVSSLDMRNCNMVIDQINFISRDMSIGDVITGKVTKITNFGVFVELSPGKEGMCHISNLSDNRVERITDLISVGDFITVKVIEIDNKGRINLRRISANNSFKK